MTELTTLCYLESDDKYLMLHRVKKKNDINKEKWIGVGGRFEYGETPEECVIREVREETGLTLHSWKFRGIVTFNSGDGLMILATPGQHSCNMRTRFLYFPDKFLELSGQIS